MTGEVTLNGRVLPIGGVKQKLLAAQRAGVTTVFIPARNEPDLDDVPAEVLDALDGASGRRRRGDPGAGAGARDGLCAIDGAGRGLTPLDRRGARPLREAAVTEIRCGSGLIATDPAVQSS